jgi:NAD(P)-dependent dehydrogenase (short-subunit alcohol dehydrogenase family)
MNGRLGARWAADPDVRQLRPVVDAQVVGETLIRGVEQGVSHLLGLARMIRVPGSNRGLGREFAAQLLERGAKKVYATARNPESVQIAGVTPLGLDITDPGSVARAAAIAGDATLIINNAGVSTGTSLMHGDLAQIELEMKTNFYGPLSVTRVFAPILASNGCGAILNVLSVIS